MEVESELFCLNQLEEVLKKDVPPCHYKIGGIKEDAVCLVNEQCWMVLTVERGQRYNVAAFPNIVEAGSEMIKRVFKLNEPEYHVEQYEKSCQEFTT